MEPLRVDRTPAVFTYAILVVGLWLLAWRITTGFSQEDFTIVVLTATLVAIMWTAHYTFRGVKHARQEVDADNYRRALARSSIAGAIHAELGFLDLSLSMLVVRTDIRNADFLKRPAMNAALQRSEIFPHHIAHQLSEFDSLLRHIEAHLALLWEEYQAAIGGSPSHRPKSFFDYNQSRIADVQNLIARSREMIPHLNKSLIALF